MSDKPEIVLPIIHMNGTSAKSLIEERNMAYNALQEAYGFLKHMAPNGRDYYPEPGRMEKATAQHLRRLSVIHDLMNELEFEIAEIDSPK
jgi:hypothetical protein